MKGFRTSSQKMGQEHGSFQASAAELTKRLDNVNTHIYCPGHDPFLRVIEVGMSFIHLKQEEPRLGLYVLGVRLYGLEESF